MGTDNLRNIYGKNISFNCKKGDEAFTDDYVLWLENQLALTDVSQKRKFLIDFCTKLELKAKQYSYLIPDEDFINEYLKT